MNNNRLVQAKVVYEDVNNDNKPVYFRNISGQPNALIDISQYKHYIPSGYQFESYGDFNRHLKDHDVNVIYIKKKSTIKGFIVVDYVANNHLIGHSTFTGKVGKNFNINQAKVAVPHNCKFRQILIGSNVKAFTSGQQIVVIKVTKIHYAQVTIEYLYHNHLISKNEIKSTLGTTFNINQYINNVPAGYRFFKVDGKVPKVIQHDQKIKIEIIKKQKHVVESSPSLRNKMDHHSDVKSIHNHASSVNDAQNVGEILMRLASSLHALGETISKNHRL